jgi:hypothetical protein
VSELVGQREVDDRALVERVALFCHHAALPEGARHIDLLAEVVHRPLEQFELIHVELLLFASSLGSHAPCTPFRVSRRDGFYFQRSSFYFFPVKSWSSTVTVKLVVRTDSELLFHRTKLNFAGGQREYFIIMITEVPVRSYGPIYSSKMSR